MQELAIAPYVSSCISPPCDITGVSPATVHYEMTQPITPVEPHALTIEATQRAADALAESQKASDKELENEKEISKVWLPASSTELPCGGWVGGGIRFLLADVSGWVAEASSDKFIARTPG